MSSSGQPFQPFKQIGAYVLAVVLSIGVTLAAIHTFPGQFLPKAEATTGVTAVQVTQPISPATEPTAPPGQGLDRSFVSTAVSQVGPAVVRIDTDRIVSSNSAPDPFFDDPFFRRFFGDDAFPQEPQQRHQRGQGSGFIVDRSGILLTNAHVVSGADKVTVTLKDGRTFEGTVKGVDETLDLAVVKINGKNLPVAPLGSSSAVHVGDWAIAVGNPLGLDNTVTLGIVSTLNRSSSQIGIPDKRLDFIQTDAAINPGNSGGPLLNAQGEVIGINTAIRADAQGIGFAIPIDTAKAIQDPLARGEQIPHPYIGIRMMTLTPEKAKEFNSDPNSLTILAEVKGVLVVQVVPDSPAAFAGIRRGDVVTEIDGKAITTADHLQNTVEASRIDQPLQFTIRRGDQTQKLTVRPGELREANL